MSAPARVEQVPGEPSVLHDRGPTAASATAHSGAVSLQGDFIKSHTSESLLLNLLAEHMRPFMSPKADIRTPFWRQFSFVEGL